MTPHAWHPFDEAGAAGNVAAFTEWLRASGRWTAAEPRALRRWQRRLPEDFAQAVAAFAGLDLACSPAAGLWPMPGRRGAVVLHRAGRRAWSRDAWRAGDPPVPADIRTMLEALAWPDVIAAVAHHLLEAGTRPDDRLLWAGAVTDPLPFAALPFGATIILADPPPADPAAFAAREGASVLRPPRAPAPG